MAGWLQPTIEGALISLHVQPRASKNEVIGVQGEELKVRLTSPPVEGAANKLCCEFLAKLCGVAKRNVTIASGEKSRHKRLRIDGASAEVLQKAIEAGMKTR